MLLLSSTSDALPGGAFPDHRDPALAHCLAGGLTLARRADGWPDLLLLRQRSGTGAADAAGTLTLRMNVGQPAPEAVAALAARGLRAAPVAYERARYRLCLRSPLAAEDQQTGVWRPALLAGGALAATSVHLTPQEDELLRTLLGGAVPAVELEADLRYLGLAPGMPWLVSAATQPLVAELAAHLRGEPATADAVAAAFLSLPPGADLLRLEALEPGAQQPGEPLLVEVARRALGALFAPVPGGDPFEPARYTLRAPAELPAALSWDLLTPRLEERAHVLRWSSAELAADLARPEAATRMFPVAADLDIFGRREVLVVNYLPLDPATLREVRVDLRATGAGGVPEHHALRFGGQSEVARLELVYAATAGFALDYRVTCVLAPPGGSGWPVLLKGEYQPADGAVVAVDAASAGLALVRVAADERVFDRCAALDIDLLAQAGDVPAARLRLTAAQPLAWAAIRGLAPDAPLCARCTAQPPDGVAAPPLALASRPVVERAVAVAAHELEVIEPDAVAISADPAGAPCAYLGVELAPPDAPPEAEGRRLTLEAGVTRTWRLFRESRFAPLRFRYRVHAVTLDEQGRTLPMRSTAWADAEGASLVVRAPGGQEE